MPLSLIPAAPGGRHTVLGVSLKGSHDGSDEVEEDKRIQRTISAFIYLRRVTRSFLISRLSLSDTCNQWGLRQQKI